MSLVNVRAQNHPQQTSKRGAQDATDDRGTDQAAPHNAKCERFFTVEDDGLRQPWGLGPMTNNEAVWCNPPYSDLRAWVEKAWKEWSFRPGAERRSEFAPTRIVMLVPANRTEQGWWQDLVEPYRDLGQGFSVEFLRGRMRFDRPDWTPGPKGDRPPFGCCLLIWVAR